MARLPGGRPPGRRRAQLRVKTAVMLTAFFMLAMPSWFQVSPKSCRSTSIYADRVMLSSALQDGPISTVMGLVTSATVRLP